METKTSREPDLRELKLCKYVPPERVDVLQHSRIRFTPPAALNDPFEFHAVIEAVAERGHIEKEFRKGLDREFAEQLRRLPKAQHAFVKRLFRDKREEFIRNGLNAHDALLPELTKTVFEAFGKRVGILSLTEDPLNQLMWAHYAANYTGFVIEFDANHEFFHRQRSPHDEFRHLRQVRYVSQKQPRTFMNLDGEEVMCTKHGPWSYEKEWRMFLPLEDCVERRGTDVHLFDIPSGAMTGVILGRNMAEGEAIKVITTARDKFGSKFNIRRLGVEENREELLLESLA